MTNLLKQAINCDDGGGAAARIVMDAPGIKTDELANYCLKDWPTDRKHRARIIGNWLQEEAEFLTLATAPAPPPRVAGFSFEKSPRRRQEAAGGHNRTNLRQVRATMNWR
jgi:hypothetical protein